MSGAVLDGVSFEYAAVPDAGVRDIDLAVAPGEVVVLCGPSGSGKSTLTRLVNGLAPQFFEGPLTGSVRVAGVDVGTAPPAQIARLTGSVFQDPRTQFFTSDVTSELAFGPENIGMEPALIRARIHEIARALDLTGLLDRSVLALSGGEQQRLACAVAGMADPPLLVLDEPSSTLDAAAVAELATALGRWKAVGKAILIAEHRLDYLAGIADRFVYLVDGRIAGRFSAAEFLALGRTRWTAMGLRAPVLEQSVTEASRPGACDGRDKMAPTAPETPVSGTIGDGGGVFVPPSLRLADVRLRRSGRDVLSIEALDVPLDRPVALIGANGAGKSTLARWVAGLAGRGGGLLELDGARLKAKDRMDACYLVAQNTNHQLFCETVLAEVMLGCVRRDRGRDKPISEDEAREILARLDLAHLATRHPLTLSGGERQRLVIAVALASRRRLVILDEPTSGLDATHMHQVAAAIETLRASGAAVVMITHDAELVEQTCGWAVHLSGGRVAASYRLDGSGLARAWAVLTPLTSESTDTDTTNDERGETHE